MHLDTRICSHYSAINMPAMTILSLIYIYINDIHSTHICNSCLSRIISMTTATVCRLSSIYSFVCARFFFSNTQTHIHTLWHAICKLVLYHIYIRVYIYYYKCQYYRERTARFQQTIKAKWININCSTIYAYIIIYIYYYYI